MNVKVYSEILKICWQHADRLQWSMKQMNPRIPFTAESLSHLTDIEVAILDQFSIRFSKLQDVIGMNLFPFVLELTKEPGTFDAFVDKLNRLEKLGAIPSANDWLMLREMRNAFAYEYPDDPEIQAAILNKAFILAEQLLVTLHGLEKFAECYL
jgi:hypothetical protein